MIEPKPLDLEETKIRKAFEKWYFGQRFVPHGCMFTHLAYEGFKAGVEYARECIKDEVTTSEETTSNKIEIELEKLKIIADYYDLPLAVFFMSVDELKELKTKEGSRMRAIRKELEKLEAFKSVWVRKRKVNEEEIIKISGLKEALKLLEERVIQRVEFDMDVKGVGRYKGRMYKGQQNLILIGLEKVQKNEYKLDEEEGNE